MATLKDLFCILIRMKRGLLFFLFWLSLIGGQAQDFLYSTRNYTAMDGLPQSQVASIVEDAHGYVWFGTEGGGLARFDGQQFKLYTTKNGLLSNNIYSILIDRHQNLWTLHALGATRFDGRTFKRFQDSNVTFSAPRFRRIYEQGDTIVLITMEGNISKIYQDSVYVWDKPLVDNKKILRYHRGPGQTNVFILEDTTFFIQSPKARKYAQSTPPETKYLWNTFNYKGKVMLNTKEGMFELDVKTGAFKKIDWELHRMVLLYDDQNNTFWTSNGNTLFKERIENGKTVSADTILRDVETYAVVKDSEGNTWLGSNGRGVYKYFIQDFNQCSSDNLRAVMAIEKGKDGAMWLGTMSKGLYKIHRGKISTYLDEQVRRNTIRAIEESPDGTIWIATGYGLGKYDKNNDTFNWFGRKEGLPSNSITTLDSDQQGNLWIGTNLGVSVYDGKGFKNYSTADGLGSNGIWFIRYSTKHGLVYVGSDYGLQVFKGDRFFTIPIPGLNNTNILGISPYQDSLLSISTGGAGVVILDPVAHTRKFISSRDGLASDFIYFAAQDEKGNLWVGTEKGINRVKLDKNLEVHENLFYGYENGLKGVETNMNAFYLSKESKYFGLIDGLYEYNDINQKSFKSFDLHLTDIQLFYGDHPITEYTDSVYGLFRIPYALQLPPDENHITFHFNRVDKRYPASVKFKYLLENFDKTWSQPSSMNYVTYSNLPPGDYVFRVMSTDNRGSWGDTKIAYPFTIKAPFYKTLSFLTGMFILLAGLVTFILYMRVKQRVNKMLMLERIRTKEQDNLRKEIARDFHDEMGNQLTRIINYVSLLKLSGANGSENGNGSNGHINGSLDLYTKVEDSAKYLYNGTRDFIWSIDPVNDELSKLFIHIRDFGEKLFEEKNIQFRAFNQVKEKVKLPYGFSREANLIFKEAMTNAFKYSEAKNVALELKRNDDDGFDMSLEDDGVGFFTGEMPKSNGLKNIRERADRINSVLRITSIKHNGTKIVLTFKLTKTLKYGLAL
jgi:signal transduction histidine kinase/streptogramin lyase